MRKNHVGIQVSHIVKRSSSTGPEHHEFVSGSANCEHAYVRHNNKSTPGMECQSRWRVPRAASSRHHNRASHTSVLQIVGTQTRGGNGTPEKFVKASFVNQNAKERTEAAASALAEYVKVSTRYSWIGRLRSPPVLKHAFYSQDIGKTHNTVISPKP